jgi:ferredoxin
MKVWVDPEKCRGHALCLTHAPDAFEFIDLEDRSVVVEGAIDSVAPEVFRAAADECPERAIIIEATIGEDG